MRFEESEYEQEPITGPCEGNDTSCIPTGEPLAPDCPDSMVGNMTGSSCNPPPEPVPNCPDNVGGNMTDNLTGIDCNPTPPVTCTDNETGCTSPVQEPPVICEGNETGCTSPGHCLDNMSLSIDCKNLENNVLPVANAGQDQVVDEGAQVILDGNNSYDTDGNITSYSWIQSSGEASVVLTDADMPSASFLAPQVDNNSTVSIELTVTDNFGTTNADQVNILIRNTNSTIIPPIEGKITLDNIPSLINAGSIFVFSGRLEISGVDGYNSSYVQIRSINNISDDILSYGVADNDGRYVMEWTAKPREMPYQVYAKYQDDFGNSLKSDDQSFKVNGTEFVYQNASALSLTQPYVALRFNNYNTKTLNVYVDATDKPSQPYVTTAIKAIKYWSQLLKDRSGNPNAWNFRIFSSNDFPSSMTSGYPINILINLEHNENSRECGSGWGGFTHTNLLDPLFRGQISARVFTGCGPQNWPEKAVFRITAHEFGHTLGLGHTWHEFDDMMCSSEYLRDFFIFNPRLVDTCNSPTDIYHDKTEPTEFDVRAVLYSYLNDGFQSPNRFGIPFVNGQYECQPLPCEPSQSSVEPKIVKPPVVKITNPKSPPIKSLIDENPEGKKKTTTVITTSKENKNSKPKILSDLSSYRLVTKLGSFGSGHGQFNHPAAISGDENGQRFYVADLDNNRIEVIHRGGNYITEWGTLGTGKGQFNGPGSIAVDNNHKLVFVSDIKNNRIEKFDTQGKYIGQWGKLGTANGQFDHPGDIALDPEKEILYVTDIYNNRIQAFYYDGNFINHWGSFGQQDGQFNRPAGITINTNYSLLYVSDTANNRIQMFDTDGKFVKEWGSLGIGNGQFARPDGIFFEPSEKAVYIADRQNSRIQVFDDQGAFITSWKVSSGINGVSIKPRDITMDPTGQLYIADKDNNNILVYNISASNASNELTSQSVKSNTDSSSRESSGSNNNKDSNGSTDKKKYLKAPSHRCDLSYPDFCIPSPPPDLDCPDISHKNFKVVGSDPHGFDRDGDGKGCESSSGTGVLDENPAKAEKGKIQVTYGDEWL